MKTVATAKQLTFSFLYNMKNNQKIIIAIVIAIVVAAAIYVAAQSPKTGLETEQIQHNEETGQTGIDYEFTGPNTAIPAISTQ